MDLEKAYNIIADKMEIWLSKLVSLLPNLIVASIILVVGLFISKYIKNLFFKGISKVIAHKNLANLATSIFHLVLIGITVFSALSVLKLDKTVTTLLAGAGVLGLALAFAFQDIAANFVSGVFIAINKPFKAGEMIESRDHTGIVEIVNLRDTLVRTFNGQIVRIPNKDIFQNPLTNFSRMGKRRLELTVGVSYGDDLERVEQVTLNAVKDISVISKEDQPKVFFKEFGDSSINLVVQVWLESGSQPVFLQGRSEAIKAIKKAYDENNIMIPFPIRTLDFGIKGGEKLSDVLPKSGS